MCLLAEVLADIRELPHDRQARYAPYVLSWWTALVAPRQDWGSQFPVIDQPHLDMLSLVADYVEARGALQGIPRDDTRDVLHRLATEMLATVENDESLPPHVRDQISADLNHVLWLLAHVETYGVAHAMRATQQAASRIQVASVATKSSTLRRLAGAAFIVIQLAASAAQIADSETIRNAVGVGAESEQDAAIIEVIVQKCLPKAIEPPRTTDEHPPDTDGDVVDAEIVG